MSRDKRPEFDLAAHPFFWMTQAMAARDAALAGELKALGLRVPDWRVLATLYARKRVSMRELADLSSIDRTTLTRTVDRMQETGWVTRLSDASDLRVTRLALTAAGERLFERIWPEVDRLTRTALKDLPRGAVDLLGWTLERMTQNLQQDPKHQNEGDRDAHATP
jgi:DNA-binding MarR family transcriptional regulator